MKPAVANPNIIDGEYPQQDFLLQELCQARHRKSGMPVCFGIPPLLEVGHGISDGSRHPFDIFLMLDLSNIHRITRTILPVKQVNIVLLTVSRFFSSETASTVHDYGSRKHPGIICRDTDRKKTDR